MSRCSSSITKTMPVSWARAASPSAGKGLLAPSTEANEPRTTDALFASDPQCPRAETASKALRHSKASCRRNPSSSRRTALMSTIAQRLDRAIETYSRNSTVLPVPRMPVISCDRAV